MVHVKWFDNLAYYVRYLAIYVIFIGTFLATSIGKLSGSEQAPAKLFEHTWIMEFPGLEFPWLLDGLGELIVSLLMIASLVTGEWMIGKQKQFLRIGISLSMLLFGIMLAGMNIAGNTEGAESLFFYAGGAAAILLLVRHDEREAEGKEVRTGIVKKADMVTE